MSRYEIHKILRNISALLLLFHMSTLQASEIEKWLLMPGKVIELHADIEADCGRCHSPLSDTEQGELCVDCHTEIGDDLSTDSGFHGRLPAQEGIDCASCHTDHEGRDAKIVSLDSDSFDHALTDFPLRGAHENTACEGCHEPSTPHRVAPTDCIGCHRPDDVHNGTLGNDCASCHTEDTWQQADFDHDTTPFPLLGGHSEVACGTCHLSSDFSDVGKTCVSCHQADDVHNGQNGPDCESCHSVDSWTTVDFDHLAVSGFALSGGHRGHTCATCHRADDHSDLGGSTCQSCHSDDDVHNGTFGSDCASCHNNRNWAATQFDHERQTGFALPPGHVLLACSSCHTESLTEELPTDCGTCHVNDDPHQGQLGTECESCHVPTTWTGQLWFDHDITSFPLIGAHADSDCESCHETAAYQDADSACVSCHIDDDTHGGALGPRCESCHNPATWEAWLFNHDEDTEFALTGAHMLVDCAGCHDSPVDDGQSVSQECNSCHRRDDRHNGRFGDNCGSCHTTNSFSQIGNR